MRGLNVFLVGALAVLCAGQKAAGQEWSSAVVNRLHDVIELAKELYEVPLESAGAQQLLNSWASGHMRGQTALFDPARRMVASNDLDAAQVVEHVDPLWQRVYEWGEPAIDVGDESGVILLPLYASTGEMCGALYHKFDGGSPEEPGLFEGRWVGAYTEVGVDTPGAGGSMSVEINQAGTQCELTTVLGGRHRVSAVGTVTGEAFAAADVQMDEEGQRAVWYWRGVYDLEQHAIRGEIYGDALTTDGKWSFYLRRAEPQR